MNLDAVGTVGLAFDMILELGKAREFARATGADDQAIDAGSPVPLTFLASALHWQLGESDVLPQVGLNQSRSLLAEHEYVFTGPPLRVGDRLVGEARVESLYEKEGRRGLLHFFEVVTEFRNETGELVASVRLIGIELPEETTD